MELKSVVRRLDVISPAIGSAVAHKHRAHWAGLDNRSVNAIVGHEEKNLALFVLKHQRRVKDA